jgi:hypothetical protein
MIFVGVVVVEVVLDCSGSFADADCLPMGHFDLVDVVAVVE